MPEKNLVLQLWPKMLSANLIAVFFDHQYLWKESIHLLHFLYGDDHQRRAGCETACFGWGWPDVLFI